MHDNAIIDKSPAPVKIPNNFETKCQATKSLKLGVRQRNPESGNLEKKNISKGLTFGWDWIIMLSNI